MDAEALNLDAWLSGCLDPKNLEDARCLIPRFDGALFPRGMEGCAMGQVLHGSATTTEAIRRAIQHSQESLRALAGATASTRRRSPSGRSELDRRCRPARRTRSRPCSRPRRKRSSSPSGDTRCCRRRLPIRPAGHDPAPDPLKPAPLPAAAWHHPAAGGRGRQASKRKFKAYPIGYFHIDIAEVGPRRAGSTSWSPSIAPRSSPSWNCTRRSRRRVAGDFLRT